MRAYLIDTENVGTSWMHILDSLGKQDKIYLLYTSNSPPFRVGQLEVLFAHREQIQLIECFCGTPNALDFQLCSLIGYLSKTAMKTEYIVVSGDNGYDAMIAFMLKMGRTVSRIDCPKEVAPKETPRETLQKALKVQAEKTVTVSAPVSCAKKYSDIDYKVLAKAIGVSENDKSLEEIARIIHEQKMPKEIHQELCKVKTHQVGVEIYAKLKPFMKQIQKAG